MSPGFWGTIDFTSVYLPAYLKFFYLLFMSTLLKSHWTQKRCLEDTCIKKKKGTLDEEKVQSADQAWYCYDWLVIYRIMVIDLAR